MTGDTVCYRRQNCKGWHDPARVLGKEGQCVLIRYGEAFYWMHPCHLMKANKGIKETKNWEVQGMKEIKPPKMS